MNSIKYVSVGIKTLKYLSKFYFIEQLRFQAKQELYFKAHKFQINLKGYYISFSGELNLFSYRFRRFMLFEK
jgi:hypothetical protein